MLTPEQIETIKTRFVDLEANRRQGPAGLAMWALQNGAAALDTIEARDATIAALQADNEGLRKANEWKPMYTDKGYDFGEMCDELSNAPGDEVAAVLFPNGEIIACSIRHIGKYWDTDREDNCPTHYRMLTALSPAPQAPESL